MKTFAELRDWLDSLPNQQDGNASYLCETGEPYIEIYEKHLARPSDVAMIEGEVAEMMLWRLVRYFDGRKGRIYWRKRLETDISEASVVVRYDDNGPDVDHSVDRKCVMDANWIRVACYCRLYRAKD